MSKFSSVGQPETPYVSPRVAVLSLRNYETHVSRACGYEFEDLICEQLDYAQLITPMPVGRFGIRQRLGTQLTRRTGWTGAQNIMIPGSERLSLGHEHDLFFFSAAQLRDLAALSAVPDWREKSRFAVCVLQEIWARDIADRNRLFDLLNQFDHVFCTFHHSLEPLRQRISVPVSFLQWSVDVERFCPYPNPPERVIDVAGIGVVQPDTEAALIRYADETGGFFHYQTVFGPSTTRSHKGHRHNYAGLLKRSKYFLCYAAKFANAERGRQMEVGLRYVEGAASGAVMLGEPIDSPSYHDWFDWPDAVIPLSPDATDPDALIRALEQDPERVEMARRASMTAALTRLDNLYRWRDVLRVAGLPETPGMQARQARLYNLATQAGGLDLAGKIEEVPRPEAAAGN